MKMGLNICALVLMGGALVDPSNCALAASPEATVVKTATLVPSRKARQPNVVGGVLPPSPAKMNMVTIRPGTVKLGSSPKELKHQSREGPEREIKIAHTFEVGKYEITFNDWNTCLAGGGCRGHRPKDAGWGKGRRPVIHISYEDAQSYIRWLNKTTGLTYRLLSEAEFEYIAEAGTGGPFGTGAAMSAADANFNGAHPYGVNKTGAYLRKTMPVGTYPPNRWGLYDLHGNAFEWVEDCWNPSHAKAPQGGKARKTGDCRYRVMKGGSWVSHGYQARSAARVRYVTDYRYDDYGFRIARTLSPE